MFYNSNKSMKHNILATKIARTRIKEMIMNRKMNSHICKRSSNKVKTGLLLDIVLQYSAAKGISYRVTS